MEDAPHNWRLKKKTCQIRLYSWNLTTTAIVISGGWWFTWQMISTIVPVVPLHKPCSAQRLRVSMTYTPLNKTIQGSSPGNSSASNFSACFEECLAFILATGCWRSSSLVLLCFVARSLLSKSLMASFKSSIFSTADGWWVNSSFQSSSVESPSFILSSSDLNWDCCGSISDTMWLTSRLTLFEMGGWWPSKMFLTIVLKSVVGESWNLVTFNINLWSIRKKLFMVS